MQQTRVQVLDTAFFKFRFDYTRYSAEAQKHAFPTSEEKNLHCGSYPVINK